MAQLMALDIGEKRTGIAITDELQIIASGHSTVLTHKLIDFLQTYFEEHEVEKLVVGLPKRLHNELSDSYKYVEEQMNLIAEHFPDIEIALIDERFTSKMAEKVLYKSGLKKKKRQNKALIDEISATIILQSFLTQKQS
ncbi:MAG: Holliday junction resolvase RuvX [bacterium]